MANIFIKPVEEYTRSINPVDQYVQQVAFYKHKMEDISLEDAANKARDDLRKKRLRNPKVTINDRDEQTDDMGRKTVSLTDYIKRNTQNDRILVPSFTAYYAPKVRKSLLSAYTEHNVKLRSADKKRMFGYRKEGNKELEERYNNLQKTRKIKNNAVSGGLASSATSLFMASGHYTLTSMTRTATSIANAVTETMVSGSRLYITEQIAFNHLIYLTSVTDKKAVRGIIDKYDLAVPTFNQLLSIIHRSSDFYWNNPVFDQKVKAFYDKLDPEEIVFFAYVNDLFHIRELNPELMRAMLDKLNEVTDIETDENLELAFYQLDESVSNAVYHRFLTEIQDFLASDKDSKGVDFEKNTNRLASRMVGTGRHIESTLEKYQDLLNMFFRNNTPPPNISRMRDSTRRCTVLSDTDSTCATYQDWVVWRYGKPEFNDESTGLSALVMMIASQVVEHYLRQYATNMGVPPENRHHITYKGEFYWATMTPMSVSKHYYADPIVQEGNVFRKTTKYDEMELERKGVNLIASNIPIPMQNVLKTMMKDINMTVRNNRLLDVDKYIRIVTMFEEGIIKSIQEGKTTYLMNVSIQEASSYKLGERSPYFHYIFWQHCFADRYEPATPPPYLGKKLPTILDTKKKMNTFIETLDEDLQHKFRTLMEERGKDYIGNMVLPAGVVNNIGIPSELRDVVDVYRMCNDICKPFYMVLESLGVFKKPDAILLDTIKKV